MRIRPDGIELLRAARVVFDEVIVPHSADDRHDTLRNIDRAMALAEDRLTRDVEASVADLAALEAARSAMRGEVLEALPDERRYDARLVAKAINVTKCQLANGHMPERREYERLAALLGAPAAAHASQHEIRCMLSTLNERLGTRIRLGETDDGTVTSTAVLAHLEATTHEALSESNPTYRRRTSAAVPSSSRATPWTARPLPHIDASLAACSDVLPAFLHAFPIDLRQAPISKRIDAWLHLNGVIGEAVYASGNAAFATQADLFGWFTRRLVANPQVPMVVVESAHQAHDLSVAIADAIAMLLKIAIAPFRRVEPHQSKAMRLP